MVQLLNPKLVFYVLNTALLVAKVGLDLMARKIIRSPFLLISWNSSPCRLLGMSTQNVILWQSWRKRRLNVWRTQKSVEMQHQQVSLCEEWKEWDRIDTLPESGHSRAANVRIWVSYLLSHIPVLWSALLPSTPIPFNYFLQYFFSHSDMDSQCIWVNPCVLVLFFLQVHDIMASCLLCEGVLIFKNRVTP